jgi:hypothetical protein
MRKGRIKIDPTKAAQMCRFFIFDYFLFGDNHTWHSPREQNTGFSVEIANVWRPQDSQQETTIWVFLSLFLSRTTTCVFVITFLPLYLNSIFFIL